MRRNADDRRLWCNVPDDHRTSTHCCPGTYRHARSHYRSDAQTRPLPNDHLPPQRHPRPQVGERAEHAIVCDRAARVDQDMSAY